MPGTGTNHKPRPHAYRPARTVSTNQDAYGDHCVDKHESYKNHHNTSRDTYSEVPRPFLIDTQPAHNPPRYVSGGNASPLGAPPTDASKPTQDPVRSTRPGPEAHLDTHPKLGPESPRDPPASRALVIDAQPSRHPVPSCGSCSWRDCRTLVCCILSCGLYCGPPRESSADPPPKPEQEPLRPEPRPEPRGTDLPSSGSFHYPDLHLNGRKVNDLSNPDAPAGRGRGGAAPRGESQRPVSSTSIYSRQDLDVDEVDDGSTDIDLLITQKLLELYKLHQIEQLAKCTSDLSFSRKTNEISDLIISIAQDYNLQEREAECRLVHGVIRISTRKHAKGGRGKSQDVPLQPSGRGKSQDAPLQPSGRSKSQDAPLQPSGRRDATLPDSGNDTMTFTFSNDEPKMLVSDSTPSDELARKMRVYSGRSVYSSGTVTTTDSSGEPLLC